MAGRDFPSVFSIRLPRRRSGGGTTATSGKRVRILAEKWDHADRLERSGQPLVRSRRHRSGQRPAIENHARRPGSSTDATTQCRKEEHERGEGPRGRPERTGGKFETQTRDRRRHDCFAFPSLPASTHCPCGNGASQRLLWPSQTFSRANSGITCNELSSIFAFKCKGCPGVPTPKSPTAGRQYRSFPRSVIAPGESRPQAHKPLMVSGCFRKPCWLCARQGDMPTCLLNASPVPGRSGIASGQAHDCRARAYGRRSDAVANHQVSPPWGQHASRTPSAFGGSHGPSVSTTRISRSRPCSLVSAVAHPAPVSVWGLH